MKPHYKEYKRYVRELVVHLRRALNLTHYWIDIEYCEEVQGRSESVAASINIDLSYLNATLYVSDVIYDYWNGGKIDLAYEAMAHEMIHIITEPLYRYGVKGVTNPEQEHLEQDREIATQMVSYYLYNNPTPEIKQLNNEQEKEYKARTRNNVVRLARKSKTKKRTRGNRKD